MEEEVISPAEFVRRWSALPYASPLTQLRASALDGTNLDAASLSLLTEAGIPADASPFLSFHAAASGTLRSAADVYGRRDQRRHGLFRSVLATLRGNMTATSGDAGGALGRYKIIGSDDVGSPLCIDSESGEVVCLDHERNFAAEPVNTTVAALLESLLIYAEFVERVTARGGDEAWLDGNVTPGEAARLAEELGRIDTVAVGSGAFWGKELARLRSQIE